MTTRQRRRHTARPLAGVETIMRPQIREVFHAGRANEIERIRLRVCFGTKIKLTVPWYLLGASSAGKQAVVIPTILFACR